jgi:hypothetical protein
VGTVAGAVCVLVLVSELVEGNQKITRIEAVELKDGWRFRLDSLVKCGHGEGDSGDYFRDALDFVGRLPGGARGTVVIVP